MTQQQLLTKLHNFIDSLEVTDTLGVTVIVSEHGKKEVSIGSTIGKSSAIEMIKNIAKAHS